MTVTRRLALLGSAALTATVAVVGSAGLASAAPAPPPPPAPASPTPCAVTAKACVDLSAKKAWLTDGAGHLTRGPVAARGGGSASATPVGTFGVLWKDADHRSRQFDNAPMPNSVFFYSGVAFHAGDAARTSNGCIHLEPAAATAFYENLQPSDPVQIVA
ncbi:MAG: L,D-transpeptidase [Pseudonocardia sp.]|nr:L,D-transpeptidase [Pseudonocardia sp.]